MQPSIPSVFHLTIRLYKESAASGSFILFIYLFFLPPFVTNNTISFSFISRPVSFIKDTSFVIVLGEIQYRKR